MKKLLNINGSMLMLSFDETYERMKAMLRGKAYKWSLKLEYDEVYQTALIALWKAFEKYNPEKYPAPFPAFAAKFIEYSLLQYHRSQRPKYMNKTSFIKGMVSLNAPVLNKDGEETELEELIGEEESYTVEIADRLVIEKIFKKFTKQQKEDVLNYVDGYKAAELAENNNLSSRVQWARIKGSFARFRTMYIKEMIVS